MLSSHIRVAQGTDVNPKVPVPARLAALIRAVLAVSRQTIKGTPAYPVDSPRCEHTGA
jgi:hypothetical protein